jgi:hypothetical protein
MWATQRSAELARQLRKMGVFDRWSEVDLDNFEACTGITCEELGGRVLPPDAPYEAPSSPREQAGGENLGR